MIPINRNAAGSSSRIFLRPSNRDEPAFASRLNAGRHSRVENEVCRRVRKAGLSGKETAVVYEQSMNSGFEQSCRGYYLRTMLGYPKIKVLDGGFDAWAAKWSRDFLAAD
jgi:3-mercaptopyruvate sulfurtransferase SseA